MHRHSTRETYRYKDSEWPSFLDKLDSDPAAAKEEFADCLFALLAERPPGPVRSLGDDREDFGQALFLKCVDKDFRVLRKYRKTGHSFHAWLYILIHNRALDYLDALGRKWHGPPLPDDPSASKTGNWGPTEFGSGPWNDVIRIVKTAMKRLSLRCRILLEFAADGYLPRDMVGAVPGTNVQISNDLRYCRKKLKKLVAAMGFDLDNLL